MRIPIIIITGYLGSGKTTLLLRILEQVNKRIAVIMNEFGELGIDGKIIRGRNIDIAELSGGCVCCSITGEFEEAVKEVIQKTNPELIILETTGVAEPDAIIADVSENIPSVKLDSVITIVDADSFIRYPNIGHTGRIQIEIADALVINKTDLVTENDILYIEKKLKEINNRAFLVRAVRCEIDVWHLFGLYYPREIKKHSPHKTEEFNVIQWSSENRIDREKFDDFLENLPHEVWRAKGFIKWIAHTDIFNYVAGRSDFEETEDSEKTEIVFIGKGIKKYEDDIIKRLKICEIKIGQEDMPN